VELSQPSTKVMKNTESYQLGIDAARAYRFGCAPLRFAKKIARHIATVTKANITILPLFIILRLYYRYLFLTVTSFGYNS
jgi:hypothetical protein